MPLYSYYFYTLKFGFHYWIALHEDASLLEKFKSCGVGLKCLLHEGIEFYRTSILIKKMFLVEVNNSIINVIYDYRISV